jgi:hypothetical protein
MAKKYKVYHNSAWVPATFIKDADDDRVWLEYDHVEDDEEGVPKEAVKRQINVLKTEIQITE